MPSQATAIPGHLTSLTLSAGINTAYTAPSGTAIIIQTMELSTNISATALGPYSAIGYIGPTANVRVWFPLTRIMPRGGIQFNGMQPLEAASYGVIISASSGSAFDVVIGGIKVIG